MKSHLKSVLLRQRIRRKKRSSKPINVAVEYSLPILPIDLIIEIFSRLPAKSIARFRCVSKLWASILHQPYFTELFSTRFSSRPQVLFSCLRTKEMLFFSIPQLQNHDEKSSPVFATFVTKTPWTFSFENFSHTNGLVFLMENVSVRGLSYDTELSAVVRNPSTGKSLSIPKLTRRNKCFLGYDPIEKQYKLLSIAPGSCEVLTLGSGSLVWRKIESFTEHYPVCNEICINGVLHYRASVNEASLCSITMLVSFDIRYEKFKFMEVTQNFRRALMHGTTLINYNGKLGSVMSDGFDYVDRRTEIFEIWVLEDPQKHEWSQQIYVVPPFWRKLVGKTNLSFVGVIGTDEIMLSQSNWLTGKFYIYYYNVKDSSVVKVEIKGMEEFTSRGGVDTVLNHVEDLKLLF